MILGKKKKKKLSFSFFPLNCLIQDSYKPKKKTFFKKVKHVQNQLPIKNIYIKKKVRIQKTFINTIDYLFIKFYQILIFKIID